MSAADFLLELRCEEIPARMQAGARAELERLFRAKYDSVRILATPSDFDMSPGPVTTALVLKAGVRPAVWVLHLPMVVLVGLVTLKGGW